MKRENGSFTVNVFDLNNFSAVLVAPGVWLVWSGGYRFSIALQQPWVKALTIKMRMNLVFIQDIYLLNDACLDLLGIQVDFTFRDIRTILTSFRVQHGVHGEANQVDPLQIVVGQFEIQFKADVMLFENWTVGSCVKTETTQHGRIARLLTILLELQLRTKDHGH